MSNYCLEHGPDESANPIIHKLECSSYDLGSLLGAGLLVNLGDFDSSALALDAVRTRHPGAVRCVDCCRSELVMPSFVWGSTTRKFAAA